MNNKVPIMQRIIVQKNIRSQKEQKRKQKSFQTELLWRSWANSQSNKLNGNYYSICVTQLSLIYTYVFHVRNVCLDRTILLS